MKHNQPLTILVLILLFLKGYGHLSAFDNVFSPSQKVVILSCQNKTVIDFRANKARIAIWSYNKGENQVWNFENTAKGYIIRSEYSQMVFTANPADSSVVQQIFDDSKYQYWFLQKQKDAFRLYNSALNLYITLPTNKISGSLRLLDYKNSKEQLWMLLAYNRTDFAQIIYGSYLVLLKNGNTYNKEDGVVALPKFSYQSVGNANLISLRKKYKLDSIAGTGTEISRIINTLHWLHTIVPHDGQHGNPEIQNAASMIAFCKKEKRGLNCRGLAMTLNECYLSLGFKSRYVTCLPKDSLKIDQDCHVINMVYSVSLGKWIWIDPTNDAYVMDNKGVMLGIEEVRERLITNKPLVLNSDANWNHKTKVVKEEYLYK